MDNREVVNRAYRKLAADLQREIDAIPPGTIENANRVKELREDIKEILSWIDE